MNQRLEQNMKLIGTLKLIIFASIFCAVPLLAHADDETVVLNQFKFEPPLGIPYDVWAYYIPKENPLTQAKVELGRQLFFEKRLSSDSTISCSSCHDPKLAFADGKRFSEGVGG